jgi:hypothetical protein
MKKLKTLSTISILLFAGIIFFFPDEKNELKISLISSLLLLNIYILYKHYKNGILAKEKLILLIVFLLITLVITGYFLYTLF